MVTLLPKLKVDWAYSPVRENINNEKKYIIKKLINKYKLFFDIDLLLKVLIK